MVSVSNRRLLSQIGQAIAASRAEDDELQSLQAKIDSLSEALTQRQEKEEIKLGQARIDGSFADLTEKTTNAERLRSGKL
jgi:hypothetical protein